MDDVLLSSRVPSSHRLSGCNGYAFCHANKLLRCCGLGGRILRLEKLRAANNKNSVISENITQHQLGVGLLCSSCAALLLSHGHQL